MKVYSLILTLILSVSAYSQENMSKLEINDFTSEMSLFPVEGKITLIEQSKKIPQIKVNPIISQISITPLKEKITLIGLTIEKTIEVNTIITKIQKTGVEGKIILLNN